jgi:hypothetical protein
MTDKFYVAFTAWGTWAAVGCALFAVWWQVVASRNLNRVQLFLQLSAQYESTDMHHKRAKLAKTLLADRTSYQLDDTVLVFFETLGHLTRVKYLDTDLVSTAFSVDVCNYWSALEPYIAHVRKELSDNTMFCEFEGLYDLLSRDLPWRHLAPTSAARKTAPPNLSEFLRWEALRGN